MHQSRMPPLQIAPMDHGSRVMSGWKPTANDTGATAVPVIYDGNLSAVNPYGVLWTPYTYIGAIHP